MNCYCCFTGSLGYRSTEQALSALGRKIGPRALYYPDGETGKRHVWITWQKEVFENSSQFGVACSYTNRDGRHFELFKPLVPPTDLELCLGYAIHACESYTTFCRLRDEGHIPSGTRFQVALPTPSALLTVFVDRESRAAVLPALIRAMAQEVAELRSKIPEEDLAITWDVAVEVVAFEGGGAPPRYPMHIAVEDIPEKLGEEIATLSNPIPSAIPIGVHLCYGSANRKNNMLRAVEPKSLQVSVEFSNKILKHCKRPVNWLHMLSPHDRLDDAWFAPLTNLVAGPDVLLGVVHLCDGVEGAVSRARAARKHLGSRRLGIAAECGLGGQLDYGQEEMETILEIHAATVDKLNGASDDEPPPKRSKLCDVSEAKDPLAIEAK